ncbi:MAG: ribosomal protein L13e [Candidatus Nezhaarchaeota archaeon]|nr:ribosomal protein L13e [Candidatus Nezhaarchaeota archaeon]
MSKGAGLPKAIVRTPRNVSRGQAVVRPRQGRGFSLSELKEAGLSVEKARELGLYVDKRRRSTHPENVEALTKLLGEVRLS